MSRHQHTRPQHSRLSLKKVLVVPKRRFFPLNILHPITVVFASATSELVHTQHDVMFNADSPAMERYYSSDNRANGLLQTTSVSSPSRSSSPSLLGLSSLLLLSGGTSKCVTNSSPSFSCTRNRLLSECISCRRAISFVSGCRSQSAVDQKSRRKIKSVGFINIYSSVFQSRSYSSLSTRKHERTWGVGCDSSFVICRLAHARPWSQSENIIAALIFLMMSEKLTRRSKSYPVVEDYLSCNNPPLGSLLRNRFKTFSGPLLQL